MYDKMATFAQFKQNDKSNSYTSGPCACFACTAFSVRKECRADANHVRDWNIGTSQCCGTWCTDQNVCVPVNDSICKTKSFTSSQWDKEAPNVKCYYNIATLGNDVSELQQLVTRFGYKQKFMFDACKIPNKINGTTKNSIFSPGAKGDLCREWYSKLDRVEKTKFIREYCVSNPESLDCKCANRLADKLYNEIKQHYAVNDGCWYSHCSDTTNQFIEPMLVDKKCPNILCSSIIKIANNSGAVNIENIKNTITCGQAAASRTTKPPDRPSNKELRPITLAHPKWAVSIAIAGGLTAILSVLLQ